MRWFKAKTAHRIIDLNEHDTLVVKYPTTDRVTLSMAEMEQMADTIKRAMSTKAGILCMPAGYEFAILRNNHWFSIGEREHEWKEVSKGDYKYKKCVRCDVIDLRPTCIGGEEHDWKSVEDKP